MRNVDFLQLLTRFGYCRTKKSVIYAMNNARYSKALWENH